MVEPCTSSLPPSNEFASSPWKCIISFLSEYWTRRSFREPDIILDVNPTWVMKIISRTRLSRTSWLRILWDQSLHIYLREADLDPMKSSCLVCRLFWCTTRSPIRFVVNFISIMDCTIYLWTPWALLFWFFFMCISLWLNQIFLVFKLWVSTICVASFKFGETPYVNFQLMFNHFYDNTSDLYYW